MASGLRPGSVDRGRLPVQQRDRRGALSALALLLVVAGALGSALVVYRSGHRTDVLVASREIKPGEAFSAANTRVARVASDTGNLIPASAVGNFSGTSALVDIPAGTLLNARMWLSGSTIPTNGVVVGVTLDVTERPAQPLQQGELVRVYYTPKQDQQSQGGTSSGATAAPVPVPVPGSAPVLVQTARVVEVATATSSNGSADAVTVSLLVTEADAEKVIQANVAGAVAVGRLPVTGTPDIDLQSAAAPSAAPTS